MAEGQKVWDDQRVQVFCVAEGGTEWSQVITKRRWQILI